MPNSVSTMFAAMLIASAAAPAHALFVAGGSGILTAGDPAADARIFGDGVTSTWAFQKSWPGFAPQEPPFNYDLLEIAFAPNSHQDVYYEIWWRNLDELNPHLVAYRDSYDPEDVSANYLGDAGFAPSQVSPGLSFQVIVPAGHSLVLLFSGRGPGAQALPAEYLYLVNAYSDADRNENFVSPIPEPASWAMMIGGFGLVGHALRGRRQLRTVHS